MSKPKTTKTLGPLHFEDLEPHRFESLVRNLLYDFRDWHTIEPTGQGGSDDGFDIRAWEKTKEIKNKDEETAEEDSEVGTLPIDGNLWMIQCKREKTLGPTRVSSIINEVNSKEPPYGYILSAPVNFTKRSYDIFRQKLREKGVKEFYMWGRGDLEDMLYLPKNDRILFTFFGFSLITQKRSRSSEIKFLLNNKNKLFRILGATESHNLRASVLLRDFADDNYPYKDKYNDFDKKPRWKEYVAYSYHPLGLWVHISEYYAYVDHDKKAFDFISSADLLHRESENGYNRNEEKEQIKDNAEDYWAHLPLKNQAIIKIDGIIFYEDMLVIDDKGDVLFNFPHIFVDYKKNNGAFIGYRHLLGRRNVDDYVDIANEGYKKTNYFPKKITKHKFGEIYKDKFVDWDEETLRIFKFQYPSVGSIFDIEGKYNFLNVSDVIAVKKLQKDYEGDTNDKYYLEITNKHKTKIGKLLKELGDTYKTSIERQVGREIKTNEEITVYEVREIYEWKFKK